MAKRQRDSVEDVPSTSKKPFVDLTASDEALISPPNKESDYKERMQNVLLALSVFKSDPAFLVKNISEGLEALEGAWYYLYESKSQHKMLKVQELIHDALKCLHDKLDTVKQITVSVAVFGDLGKGKSFFLNHLLTYGMEKVMLLPSGEGGSKTPVPVKVRYATDVKITIKKKKKVSEVTHVYEEIFFRREVMTNDSLKLAGKRMEELFFDKASLTDVEYVELAAPLPVFDHLRSVIIESSKHRDVNVNVEFVDLPGCGDKIGNALIDRELDLANVIMFFQAGCSGRPVTADDLTSVFRRRKVFQYPDRPKFVHVVNERNKSTNLQSEPLEFDERLLEKKTDLDDAWKALEKKDPDECYEIVYQRLPQLSRANILQKMRQESEVIIFEPEKDFVSHLGKAISMHVEEVQMKKNAHAVVQEMLIVSKQLRKRTTQVITQKRKKALQGKGKSPNQSNSKHSKPLKNRSFTIPIPTEMEEEEEDGLVDLFEKTPEVLEVRICNTSAITEVNDKLIDVFFSQEMVMQHLLKKLNDALKEHWNGLLEEADQTNQLSLCESRQGVMWLAKVLCNRHVDKFMTEEARNFIKATVDKLKNRSPKQELKKEWENADEVDKTKMISQLLKYLLADLTKMFQRPTRRQMLHKLLDKLLEVVNELIELKLDYTQVDEGTLNSIFKKIKIITDFSREKIRDVNPHPSLGDVFLDHNVEFPALKVPEVHESIAFKRVNTTQVLEKVSSIMLGKVKGDPLKELRTKLNLSSGVIDPPSELGLNEFEWTRVLLNVLCEPRSHLESSQEILKSLPGGPIKDEHMSQARQQLFAYQRSNASCELIDDQSVFPGEIHIKFNESKNGITALVNAGLRTELLRMRDSLKDRKTQLAPIFIPTIHPGPDPNMLGNLYLEEDPWSNDDETEDKTMSEGKDQTKGYGLGDLNATIFLVVEPRHLELFKSTLDKKPPPPGSKIVVRYVVLPQNGRGIGVSRSIIKMLAERLELSLYWTIDDDIKLLYEFDSNTRRWQKCSFGRALLFVQRVFQDCTEKAVNDLDEDQRQDVIDDVIDKLFPVWAKKTKRKARQLFEEHNFKTVLENQALLNSPFTVDNSQVDCGGDPKKEEQLQKTKSEFIKECKSRLQKDTFKRIAGVSVGHEAGKLYDYVSMYAGMHYRKSDQRYQMVLHNTDALKGFNYVQDDVVLKEEEGTIFKKKMLDIPYMGCKREDKSFCHALAFYGITGYQVIPVVIKHQKLRNAFGSYCRSYENEPVNEEEDKVVSGNGKTSDLEENGNNKE